MNLAKCMVPVWFLRALHVQSNSQNCEHLKLCLECLLCCRYNQSWVRSLTTENKETHVQFPLFMKQICFISKGLKINPLF